MVKKLTKLVPVIGSFLIFCGVLKLILFYRSFNINILYFLELNEVLILFFNDLIGYSLILVIGIAFNLILKESRDQRREKEKKKIIDEKKFLKRFWLYMKFRFDLLIIIFFILVTGCVFVLFRGGDLFHLNELCIIFVSWFLILFLFIEVERNMSVFYKTQITFSIQMTFMLIMFLLTFVISSSFNDVYNIKNRSKYFGTQFKVGNTLITSDHLNYFIGKTKNYLFFYKECSCETIVYPMGRVKEITFKKIKSSYNENK